MQFFSRTSVVQSGRSQGEIIGLRRASMALAEELASPSRRDWDSDLMAAYCAFSSALALWSTSHAMFGAGCSHGLASSSAHPLRRDRRSHVRFSRRTRGQGWRARRSLRDQFGERERGLRNIE